MPPQGSYQPNGANGQVAGGQQFAQPTQQQAAYQQPAVNPSLSSYGDFSSQFTQKTAVQHRNVFVLPFIFAIVALAYLAFSFAGSNNVIGVVPTDTNGSGAIVLYEDGRYEAHGTAEYDEQYGNQLPGVGKLVAADGDGKGGVYAVNNVGQVYAFNGASYKQGLAEQGVSINNVVDIIGYSNGYRIIDANGGVYDFGVGHLGSVPGYQAAGYLGELAAPIVGAISNGSSASSGYWLVGRDGGLFNFGAPYIGAFGDLEGDGPGGETKTSNIVTGGYKINNTVVLHESNGAQTRIGDGSGLCDVQLGNILDVSVIGSGCWVTYGGGVVRSGGGALALNNPKAYNAPAPETPAEPEPAPEAPADEPAVDPVATPEPVEEPEAPAEPEPEAPAATNPTIPASAPLIAIDTSKNDGYLMLARNGEVFAFGSETKVKDFGGCTFVDIAAHPTGTGYWALCSNGQVFASGGSASLHQAAGKTDARTFMNDGPATAIVASPTGNGYVVASAGGGVFAFGDMANKNLGSAYNIKGNGPINLLNPVVDIELTADGNGAWLVTSQGLVIALGSAESYGDMSGAKLAGDVTSISRTRTGNGYVLSALDGGIFSFGDAQFDGGANQYGISAPATDVVYRPNAERGYFQITADGAVFAHWSAFKGRAEVAFSDPASSLSFSLPENHASVVVVTPEPSPETPTPVEDPGVNTPAPENEPEEEPTAVEDPGTTTPDVVVLPQAPEPALPQNPSTSQIVGVATNSTFGYWIAARDGGVFSYGLDFHGSIPSLGLKNFNDEVVDIEAAPSGSGYMLITDRGGVHIFGDGIEFHGSDTDKQLAADMVGVAIHPQGTGYVLVAADGGVFTHGSVSFEGNIYDRNGDGDQSDAINLGDGEYITDIAMTPSGNGYWLVSNRGGVFTFGDAQFNGAVGDRGKTITSISRAASGNGYFLTATDGTFFKVSDGTVTELKDPVNGPVVDGAIVAGNGRVQVTAGGAIYAPSGIEYRGGAVFSGTVERVVTTVPEPEPVITGGGGSTSSGGSRCEPQNLPLPPKSSNPISYVETCVSTYNRVVANSCYDVRKFNVDLDQYNANLSEFLGREVQFETREIRLYNHAKCTSAFGEFTSVTSADEPDEEGNDAQAEQSSPATAGGFQEIDIPDFPVISTPEIPEDDGQEESAAAITAAEGYALRTEAYNQRAQEAAAAAAAAAESPSDEAYVSLGEAIAAASDALAIAEQYGGSAEVGDGAGISATTDELPARVGVGAQGPPIQARQALAQGTTVISENLPLARSEQAVHQTVDSLFRDLGDEETQSTGLNVVNYLTSEFDARGIDFASAIEGGATSEEVIDAMTDQLAEHYKAQGYNDPSALQKANEYLTDVAQNISDPANPDNVVGFNLVNGINGGDSGFDSLNDGAGFLADYNFSIPSIFAGGDDIVEREISLGQLNQLAGSGAVACYIPGNSTFRIGSTADSAGCFDDLGWVQFGVEDGETVAEYIENGTAEGLEVEKVSLVCRDNEGNRTGSRDDVANSDLRTVPAGGTRDDAQPLIYAYIEEGEVNACSGALGGGGTNPEYWVDFKPADVSQPLQDFLEDDEIRRALVEGLTTGNRVSVPIEGEEENNDTQIRILD